LKAADKQLDAAAPVVLEEPWMDSLGSYLRKQRELQQLSVAELAQTTRIPVRILRQIEEDCFDQLPAEVFVRGFLRAYAQAVETDGDRVIAWYEGRYSFPAEPSRPLATVSAPETGRSFGVAIALVILLILFTLAFSFVLRPRHREAPVELSCVGQLNPPMRFFSAPSTTATPTASSRC
jgi:cytoskeletal protein RodZ